MAEFDEPTFRYSVNDGMSGGCLRAAAITAEVQFHANAHISYLFLATFSEPNEEWTVEEVFQWTLLRSYKLIDERCETIAENLRNELTEGGKQLEYVRKDVAQKEAVIVQSENRPNGDTKPVPKATSTRATRSDAVLLRVEVVESAAYDPGHVFELKVTKKNKCSVGRSSGKKYKTNGISLSKDLEVSTSHGKFELHKDGNVYYTDTGSTNGSFGDGEELTPDTPYMIQNGTILRIGSTKFECKIV